MGQYETDTKFLWTTRTFGVEITFNVNENGAMIEYQSRIIGPNGKLSLLILSVHTSDRSAIQAATKMCRPSETVSVWRDDLCIYDEAPKAGLWFVWPIVSANPRSFSSPRKSATVEK